MQWRNHAQGYGLPAILFHWLVAAGVFGLFGLGLWMVDLGYMDPYYRSSVALHKSLGILLFLVVAARLAWRLANPSPRPLGRPWERRAAAVVHGLLYLLLFATMIAGYLISTADGRPINVFGWFEVPATLTGDLTLKGVTREVTIDVEQIGHGEDPWGGYRRGFQGETKIRLRDFNIDFDLGPSAREAYLELAVEGIRQ